MKIRSFLLQTVLFTAVFLFFLLPPLFQGESSESVLDFSQPDILFLHIFQTAFSVALLYAVKSVYGILPEKKNPCKKNSPRAMKIAVNTGAVLVAFGELCVCAAVLQFAAAFSEDGRTSAQVIMPEAFPGWILCVVCFLLAAFYEESVYRFFLPETFSVLLKNVVSKAAGNIYGGTEISSQTEKRCVLASEIFSAAVFAFSHRYLGFFAVLNGAAGYCILRICLKKTGSLVPGCIAHFLYNLLNLMLLSAF